MKKESTIYGHVRDISSISHLVWHKGEPCDLYTATVRICQVGYTGAGLNSWYLVIRCETEAELESKLDKYRTDEIVSVPVADLIDKRGRSYGEARK